MKISINGLHVLAVAFPVSLFLTDLPAPWPAYVVLAMFNLGSAILATRFLEKIKLAKKAEEESKVTETKELRRLVFLYDSFCRELGAAAKEKGLAVVFDDEVFDNPEYTGSIWVIGSGSKVTQGFFKQPITLAPRSCNGYFITAMDPAMFSGALSAFDCYSSTDPSFEIKA